MQALLAKGLERKPRLLALQRDKAGIDGEQAALRGRIAANLEAIAQAKAGWVYLRSYPASTK